MNAGFQGHSENKLGSDPNCFDVQGAFGLLVCFWGFVLFSGRTTIVTEGSCPLTDAKTAEMCKLTENSFRDVNIAFANELSSSKDA
jgi:hypothetical protein